jgi:hypothetical protein
MSKSKERSMLNNFRQWLPNKLAQQLLKVKKVKFIGNEYLYGILKPTYIPKELKDSWANQHLFDVLYWRDNIPEIIIIEPSDKEYGKYIVINDLVSNMLFGKHLPENRYWKWMNWRIPWKNVLDMVAEDGKDENKVKEIFEILFENQQKYITEKDLNKSS